jgi:TolA-binding protein
MAGGASVVEEDIQEIKREAIETHNLIIKTDNLIKNLSTEIRQIEKKQESYEKKYLFNSVMAYVLFVILIFAGLYIAFDAKVGVERKENEALTERLNKTQSEADELQKKLSARAQQEKIADQFLRLKQENREIDALKVAEGMDLDALSPLLGRLVQAEVDNLKTKIGEKVYEDGKALFLKGDLERALRELDRIIDIHLPGPMLARVQTLRGMILSKLNRSAAASEAFLVALDADPKSANAESTLFNAANALETSGDVPRALELYRRLLSEYPKSPFSAQAKWKVDKFSSAEKKGVSVPVAPAPAPVNAGTPAPASPPPGE